MNAKVVYGKKLDGSVWVSEDWKERFIGIVMKKRFRHEKCKGSCG